MPTTKDMEIMRNMRNLPGERIFVGRKLTPGYVRMVEAGYCYTEVAPSQSGMNLGYWLILTLAGKAALAVGEQT